MSSTVVFVTESRVRSLITWEKTFAAVEAAMRGVSAKRAFQNARTFTPVANKDSVLLTMPGYLEDEAYGALACKLVTAAKENENRKPPLPSILANIALFDSTTGELKAIVAATEITSWRTAAASAVATKYLHVVRKKQNLTLAILGAGVQGRIHAIAFQHFFKFNKVNIWNRTATKADKLAEELNGSSANKEFKSFSNVEECVKDADVIVTATSAAVPFLKLNWIKPGVHINAVGAGADQHHSELEEAIYKNSDVYIDHWEGAKSELSGLETLGVRFRGEIGELISGGLTPSDKITIFQSLGMATEDCAMARMIYDLDRTKP